MMNFNFEYKMQFHDQTFYIIHSLNLKTTFLGGNISNTNNNYENV